MKERRKEIAALIKRRNIEIFCVQETNWNSAKVDELDSSNKVRYRRNNWRRNTVGIIMNKKLETECTGNVEKI